MLLSVLGLGVGAYLTVGAGLYLAQRQLLYRPDTTRVDPATIGLDVREVVIERPDGARLIAWRAKAAPGKPTLLYFHGNGGNLAGRHERIALYRSAGYGVFMLSYRGYSGSTGSPSEAANVADALAAYDLLAAEGVAPRDIVLYGESLGTGVAVQVASTRAVGGVILDAPYTAIVDIAAAHYFWLPVHALMQDRYDSLSRIADIKAPLLVLHGARDTIVPLAMGQAVFAAAKEPKQMHVFPQAGHLFHTEFGSFEVIRAFVDGLER
jgi:fermentation-respiration switch protein FrsA (DUF1100 family)